MTGKAKYVVLAAFAAIAGLVCLAYYQFRGPPATLHVLCGSSMSLPVEEIKGLFEAAHGPIALDMGGSETLLPRVLTGAPADIFVCHDPFEEKVREAGMLSDSVATGVLRPVLLVAPGNPRGIRSIDDLTRDGLQIGIGDPRYSTCGEMFVDLLKRKKIYDAVMGNVAFQGRAHGEITNGLIVGKLHAVVVWNFVARLHKDKVELVPTNDEYPPVRVTVLGLKQSTNPRLRDAFLEFCRRPSVQQIFQSHGYGARD
jgi:molybdate transport system substrate-binding protein